MEINLLLIFIFSVVGILDTSYLIYHMVRKTPVKCFLFPKEWCLKVQQSKQSKTFGIPNPIAGFFIYSAILLLFFLYLNGSAPFFFIQILIAIGFLFSIYFVFVQAFILRAFCTWCMLSAVNFVIMAVAAFLH